MNTAYKMKKSTEIDRGLTKELADCFLRILREESVAILTNDVSGKAKNKRRNYVLFCICRHL